MRRLLCLGSFALVSGVLGLSCASYHPKPIEPQKSARSFAQRRLDDEGLLAYVRDHAPRDEAAVPPKTWDLDSLTLAALFFHPDLDVARARWGVAQAEAATAGLRPNPLFDFVPQRVSNAEKTASPWVLNYALDLTLETGGKRGARIERARALAEAERFRIAETAWAVRSRLRRALVERQAALRSWEILEELSSVREALSASLEKRAALGEVSEIEARRGRQALEQTRVRLAQAKKGREVAQASLAASVGLPADAAAGLEVLPLGPEPLPASVSLSREEIERDSALRRSDLLASLAEYAASEAEVRQAVAQQYPDIHLLPGYEYDQGLKKWAIGFSLALPLASHSRAQIAEAEARRELAAAQFRALQDDILSAASTAYFSYNASREALTASGRALQEEQRLARSARALFDSGETDRLAWLGGRETEAEAALANLEAWVLAQQAFGALEDAVEKPLAGGLTALPSSEAGPRPPVKETP